MVDLVCPLGVGHLQPIPRSIARFLPVVLLYLSKDYSLFGTYPSVESGGVFHDYDTFLGNKAVDEEIACHININVISEYDYDESSVESDSSDTPSDNSTIKTGDSRSFTLYIVIAVFSVIILALITIFRKKHSGVSKND